ncbi:LysR family transcriptional regulator [Cupriavidus sp. 30B13]|uniref:LysR family transcriptional regulator n=1 Tax=Cupriavidus sp. 30B13 TaxID=3384241 RepID=UPI003B91FBEC
MALTNFNDIAVFVAVVQAGSFTVAGKRTGLTRSAVGKAVARLEEGLGVRLLNRTPRSLSLTDDGKVFHARCAQLIEDLEETEQAMAARGARPAGVLRLSVPIALGHRHVLPVVERLLDRWEAIAAEVSFTDRFVDLIDEGMDIAVRIGEADTDSRLIARTVARQTLVTCAAPAYLARHGVPSVPADLERHRCLHFLTGGKAQPWKFAQGEDQVVSAGRLDMDSAEALISAAVNGAGIVHLPTYLLDNDVAAGRLVPVLAAYRPASVPIRVIYPTRKQLSPKIRAFIDLLIESWSPLAPWERVLP